MKSLVKSLVVLTLLFSTTTIQAQLNAGLGIDYGSEVEEAGLDLRVGYMITDQINLVGDFNFFFVDDEGRYIDNTYWNEVNFNAHYYFTTLENVVSPYALGGLNLTFYGYDRKDHPVFDDFEVDESELGLNLGGGIDIRATDQLRPFLEVKYLIIDDVDQGELAFGLKYFIQ